MDVFIHCRFNLTRHTVLEFSCCCFSPWATWFRISVFSICTWVCLLTPLNVYFLLSRHSNSNWRRQHILNVCLPTSLITIHLDVYQLFRFTHVNERWICWEQPKQMIITKKIRGAIKCTHSRTEYRTYIHRVWIGHMSSGILERQASIAAKHLNWRINFCRM